MISRIGKLRVRPFDFVNFRVRLGVNEHGLTVNAMVSSPLPGVSTLDRTDDVRRRQWSSRFYLPRIGSDAHRGFRPGIFLSTLLAAWQGRPGCPLHSLELSSLSGSAMCANNTANKNHHAIMPISHAGRITSVPSLVSMFVFLSSTNLLCCRSLLGMHRRFQG